MTAANERRALTVKTDQLDRLSDNLVIMDREFTDAIKISLKAATLASLKTTISEHYNIRPEKLSNTHRIATKPYSKQLEEGIYFEVIGRLLTPARFSISPLRNMYMQPTVEILKGQPKKAGKQQGADGKAKTPFVMRTKRNDGSGAFNVFVGTGRQQQQNRDKESLRSYRTVSVPQMLGNEAVYDQVQDDLLRVFDNNLLKQIEKKTQLLQENILKG